MAEVEVQGELVEMTAESIKLDLWRALEATDRSSNRISCSGILASVPDPDLFVRGVGNISLPLSSRDAHAITNSKVSKQDPSANGSEMVVDFIDTKSWQIDPLDFQLRNPEIRAHFEAVTKTVCARLRFGCHASDVSAEMFKLVLHEDGAFFQSHWDGNKAKDVFGTLMICLPAPHTGGELELEYEGRSEIIRTADDSHSDYTWAAWYTNVCHKPKAITSGNRLFLIYKLLRTASVSIDIEPPSATRKSETRLRKVLSQWQALCADADAKDIPRALAVKLSHKYTGANLSFEGLKGNDHSKVHHLRAICATTEIRLLLAQIRKRAWGQRPRPVVWIENGVCQANRAESMDDEEGVKLDVGSYHQFDGLYRSSIRSTRVVEYGDNEVPQDLDLRVREIVQGDIFWRIPDKQYFSEDKKFIHDFYETVVLLVADTGLMQLQYRPLKHCCEKLEDWIVQKRHAVAYGSDERHKLELKQMCDLVILDQRGRNSKRLNAVAIAAVDMNDLERLDRVAELAEYRPSIKVFTAIREAILRFGFERFEPALTHALAKLENVHENWVAVLEIAGGASALRRDWDAQPEGAGGLPDILRSMLTKDWLVRHGEGCSEDAVALAQMANFLGVKVLKKRILPFVESNLSDSLFSLAFIGHLFQLRGSEALTAAAVEDVYSRTIPKILARLLTRQRESKSRDKNGNRYILLKKCVDSAQFIETLQTCEILGLQFPVDYLVQFIDETTSHFTRREFSDILLPYLKALLAHLREGDSVSILGKHCGAHIYRMIQAYLVRKVGPPPKERTTWGFSGRACCSCSCDDCRELRKFVRDSERRTCEFRLSKARQSHLVGEAFMLDHYRCEYDHMSENDTGSESETSSTQRVGSFIVTKRDRGYEDSMRRWQQRWVSARDHIRDLDSDPWLKRVLGDQHERIVSLACVEDTILPAPSLEGLSLWLLEAEAVEADDMDTLNNG